MAIKLVGIIKIVAILVVLIIAGLLSYNLYFSDWVETSRSRADINNGLSLGSVREEPQPGEIQILPTADPKWNLYRNFKYGFQIQYPAEWRISMYKKQDKEVFWGFTPPSYTDYQIVLNFYLKNDLNSILNIERSKDSFLREEVTNINNNKFTKVFMRNPYLGYDTYSYFSKSSNFSYSLGSGGTPLNSWYIDRMIETLEVF